MACGIATPGGDRSRCARAGFMAPLSPLRGGPRRGASRSTGPDVPQHHGRIAQLSIHPPHRPDQGHHAILPARRSSDSSATAWVPRRPSRGGSGLGCRPVRDRTLPPPGPGEPRFCADPRRRAPPAQDADTSALAAALACSDHSAHRCFRLAAGVNRARRHRCMWLNADSATPSEPTPCRASLVVHCASGPAGRG